jgi:DNA polymerase-3 subunit alpha
MSGRIKSRGVHPGGTVVAPADAMPLPIDRAGVCEYSMDDIEAMGLLKYDFLGLKALTVLKHKPFNEASLTPEVKALFDTEYTFGIFQLENSGIAGYARKYNPQDLGNLSDILAIYRPGPLESGIAADILRIRAGGATSEKNIFVYQEDIMRFAVEKAGYSLKEADELRKAIGKKKPEELAKHANRFKSEDWASIEKFGAYCFNKAHSISYAQLALETAYFKAHYPEKFYLAMLDAYAGDKPTIIKTLLSMKYDKRIKPLSIPSSHEHLVTEVLDGSIRLGLNLFRGIKGQPKKTSKPVKDALCSLTRGSIADQIARLGMTLQNFPKGKTRLVCHVEKRTAKNSGNIYWLAILDSGEGWKQEAFFQEEPPVGEFI